MTNIVEESGSTDYVVLPTVKDIVDEALRLADAKPEFVYVPPGSHKQCKYEYNGAPSCLFGQALANLGVPVERLAEFDRNPIDGSIDYIIKSYDFPELDGHLLNAARHGQNEQDLRTPWGEVAARMRKVMGR